MADETTLLDCDLEAAIYAVISDFQNGNLNAVRTTLDSLSPRAAAYVASRVTLYTLHDVGPGFTAFLRKGI